MKPTKLMEVASGIAMKKAAKIESCEVLIGDAMLKK